MSENHPNINQTETDSVEQNITVEPDLVTEQSKEQMVEQQSGESASEQLVFTPPIDIYESEEGLILHADLPGVSSETLELQVQDNKLTLFGRVTAPVAEDAVVQHCEYQVGNFLRSFILSDEVNHDQISATLNHGVLKVVLPKAPQAEARRIQVSSD